MKEYKIIFHREVKDHWYVQYNNKDYPHVQQGMILNPERLKEFDPFILMGEEWFKRGTFPDHPHKGIQTITYVLDGRLEHFDNAGGHSILEPGDVQYMNAGWAARHTEEAVDEDILHTLQLWLNLPKRLKNSKTSYQNIRVEDVPQVPFDGGAVKVYSGDVEGVKGPLESLVPITMSEIIFAKGGTYSYRIPENHNAFLYVLSGDLEIGKNKITLSKTGVATLTFNEKGTNDSELVIKANERSKVLIYSGVQLNEDVVLSGPFVMNTMEEIQQAHLDFNAGKFGPPAK